MDNNLLENAKLDEALSMFVQGILDLKEAGVSMKDLREVTVAYASGIRRFAAECLVDDLDVALETLEREPGQDSEDNDSENDDSEEGTLI